MVLAGERREVGVLGPAPIRVAGPVEQVQDRVAGPVLVVVAWKEDPDVVVGDLQVRRVRDRDILAAGRPTRESRCSPGGLREQEGQGADGYGESSTHGGASIPGATRPEPLGSRTRP